MNLVAIAQGLPTFARFMDRERRRGRRVCPPEKVEVLWRVKSLAPFLPARDVRWTHFGFLPRRGAQRFLRALNREDPIFEFRFKPTPSGVSIA